MKSRIPVYLTLFLALCLTGCSGGTESGVTEENSVAPAASVDSSAEYTKEVFAMDTYITLKGYGGNAEAALEEISGEITGLDSQLSVTDPDSEIYALDHSDGTPVSLSATARTLISFGRDLWEKTGGALDISVYPVVRAWGFTGDEYRIPSDAELAELLTHVDSSGILVDDAAGTVTLESGMELDLGAMVKGYSCDLARDILQKYGVSHALLNLGGSTIGLVGTKPDGSLWKVAVQDPEDTSTYAGILEVKDCVIDTSGGYERYFTDEAGNVYWHIIDPATGKPADSGLISTTVVSDSGILGDALSTACFVMGLEDSIAYWRENDDFEFIFITEEHDIYLSEGIADSFTPMYAYADANVTVVHRE